MKLNLALFALLQQALCAPQPVDPADLHSDRLDAWIGQIAAKRQLSKDEVRSQVQAATYHLEPEHGGHAQVERRQSKPLRTYPVTLGPEMENDRVTGVRIMDYNGQCRRANQQPPDSPFTPNYHVFSFWRSAGGDCDDDGLTVRIACQLPRYYAPANWNPTTTRVTRFKCPVRTKCTSFRARSFAGGPPATWGGCTEEMSTPDILNPTPTSKYSFTYPCLIRPDTTRQWYIYAETSDGKEVKWTMFTGRENSRPTSATAPSFLFADPVSWRGKQVRDRPSFSFERIGQPATIRVFNVVL